MVAEHRGHSVDTLLVKNSSPQVAPSGLPTANTVGNIQGLAGNRKCFPPLQSYAWLALGERLTIL